MISQNIVPNDNIISYDSGDKVFQHDKERGKWSSNWDFLTACIGHSFSVVNFSITPMLLINEGVVLFIILYILGSVLFTIPIIFIQSFLGQFSSTGFISAFRIAPMFKGIGYVILCLNLITACYHSVFTAIPLLYIFKSIGPHLPWISCSNPWNTYNCIEVNKYSSNQTNYYDIWSTEEFYNSEIAITHKTYWSLSWTLLATTFFIWILLGVILSTKIKIIGQLLRYLTFTMIILLLILFIRILCLPNSFVALLEFLSPKSFSANTVFNLASLFLSALSFGSGWGTILTLASYNDFKINIGKMSVMICISHLIVILICGTMHYIIKNYLNESDGDSKFDRLNHINSIFTMFPLLFGNLEAPQMWSVLYFLLLFLGEFSSNIIQILSIVTAIFDEFVKLRTYKNQIKLGLLSCLALFSIGYTFRNGIYLVIQIMNVSRSMQMFICFIELMIVVWIYGRLRFQRDIKFMIGLHYSTWKFAIIRFVTPIFVLTACIMNILHSIYSIFTSPETNTIWLIMSIFLKSAPILVIPIYIVIRLSATTGTLLNRFRRLCKPTDWYPVDPIQRQKYEEYLGNPDITHQLVDVNELETEDN